MSPYSVYRRTLGVAALKAGKQAESELHRTYDNLTAAYSTEVSTTISLSIALRQIIKPRRVH